MVCSVDQPALAQQEPGDQASGVCSQGCVRGAPASGVPQQQQDGGGGGGNAKSCSAAPQRGGQLLPTFLPSSSAFLVTKRVWGMGPSTLSTSSSTPAGRGGAPAGARQIAAQEVGGGRRPTSRLGPRKSVWAGVGGARGPQPRVTRPQKIAFFLGCTQHCSALLTITHVEHPLHLATEVSVAGGVDNVHFNALVPAAHRARGAG